MNPQEPASPLQTRQNLFASRMAKTPKSFIREILKVTEDPRIISFAGGLPNPALIDVEGIASATARVLEKDGRSALQYSTTEGLPAPPAVHRRPVQKTARHYCSAAMRSLSPTGPSNALTSSGRSSSMPGTILPSNAPDILVQSRPSPCTNRYFTRSFCTKTGRIPPCSQTILGKYPAETLLWGPQFTEPFRCHVLRRTPQGDCRDP